MRPWMAQTWANQWKLIYNQMIMNEKNVMVIGAGPAGLACATALAKMGVKTSIIEKDALLGGHLRQWHALFPNHNPAFEVLAQLTNSLPAEVVVYSNSGVEHIERTDLGFKLFLSNKDSHQADALVIATGFDSFDAHKKEEYGYGIYRNVATSVDLEQNFDSGNWFLDNDGNEPSAFAFVHCVGSRDEKVGNNYCSKVCCVTAVKQAIGLRKKFPHAAIYCLYMDLRMFGRHYEELYREAQELHQIRFIRGRLSEAFETPNGTVLLKVEDTLAGARLKFSVDKLFLMVGMVPSTSTINFGKSLKIDNGVDKFLNTVALNPGSSKTNETGVFITGTCTGPATLPEVINAGKACALDVYEFITC